MDEARQSGVYEVNLFFEEAMPKREMPALLSAATVASNLVTDLPEAWANSANKFFDTLAAKKPVLLNHGGWMNEIVQRYGCGLAVWQHSLAEVAAELDYKMHDENWLNEAGEAAGTLAVKFFDRDALAKQLIAVLEAAAKGCPEKAGRIAPGKYESESL